ncbi:YigZ family protein [Aerococcaceae bacterium NML201209]|nr:YigZ family protein [Aerococcaceae bacterium NML201209]
MNYLSIQAPCVHEIDIKKSRFICYLFPVKNVEEADAHLTQLRKEHYKATHRCYAYILNENASVQKMSDDGEPAGTAGVPMLEVLKQRQLTYILAVVVRYFGGIKLGAGGLIRAYGQAVSHALEQANIIQNISQIIGKLNLSYAQIDSFNYFLTQTDLPVSILETQYTDCVTYQFAVHLTDMDALQQHLNERFNGEFSLEILGEQTIDIPYIP